MRQALARCSFCVLRSPLRLLLRRPRRLLLCDLDLRVAVRTTDEYLATGPAEDQQHEHEREYDVPGRDDQLLRARVGDSRLVCDITARVQRQRVRRLGDADGAGREG